MSELEGAQPFVLVVEDEEHLAAGLKLNLSLEGFDVEVAGTGREAMAVFVQPRRVDAVVLDVMLPDADGFELCERLRASGNFVPVIMLTARGAADDRVRGLDVGADDYMSKPFELAELIARLNSLLRRQSWEGGQRDTRSDSLAFGTAEIDFTTHRVTVSGENHNLTHLELELLRYFAENAGRVVSREELLEKVWKMRHVPNTRTVDNFISRLRKVFEADPKQPRHFLSHRGSGYRFVPY
ncbi:MAG: response regulator transcription factor [Myxococcota bacterium]